MSGQCRRFISVRLDSSAASASSVRPLIRSRCAVQPCAAAAARLEALARRRVQDHAEQRLAVLDQGDADRELAARPRRTPGCRRSGRPPRPARGACRERSSTRSSDSQPSSGRAPRSMSCSRRVDRQVGFGDHLARRLVPARAAGAEMARAPARRPRRPPRAAAAGRPRDRKAITGPPRSCPRSAGSARRCRSGTRGRRPASAAGTCSAGCRRS